MLSIHLDILDDKRKDVFFRLKSLKNDGYLAGGTALSLQIRHRHSFDFDIFLPREIKRKEYLLLKRYFPINKVILNTNEQLSVITKDNIIITLIFYPYTTLFSCLRTNSISLLSLKDIAADKVFTIGRRGIWRDYVDIFFLLMNEYISFSEIVKLAKRKFREEFNEKLFLEQLIYFKDLGKFKIAFIKEKYSENTIKKYLVNEVKKYQLTLINK